MTISKFDVKRLLLGFAALAALAAAGGAFAQTKVVYHFSDGLEQATNGLRNIGNHLEVDPKATVVAITHARGVDFLMEGAKTSGGYPFELMVQELKARGVQFQVCEITLRNRKLEKKQFIAEAGFVPSGVVEIAKLQGQGHAYIKP